MVGRKDEQLLSTFFSSVQIKTRVKRNNKFSLQNTTQLQVMLLSWSTLSPFRHRILESSVSLLFFTFIEEQEN